MAKEVRYQAEIDRLVQEKRKEYEQFHLAKIEMKYGNTYISYGMRDYITENMAYHLQKLFDLMKVRFSTNIPIDNTEFYYILEGEDECRAQFIQKFIDNGYKLEWR